MHSKKSVKEAALFDISTVARLTGLSPANIRMWEKRYEVVEPERAESGRRLYTEQDVHRLTILKSLSDFGHPIRTTAPLPGLELEKRFREASMIASGISPGAQEGASGTESGACRVAVVGHNLVTLLAAEDSRLEGTTTVAEFDDLETAESGDLPTHLDLLVVECPTLFEDTADRVRRLIDMTHALRAIVVYHFAQHQTIEMMEHSPSRITAIRAPINSSELAVACGAEIALANRRGNSIPESMPPAREFSGEIPERSFTDRQIAQISSISTAIACECPNHLASLLTSLLGFEKYSRECENRNAVDAEIHSYLHNTTAHARAAIEDALKVLVEFEGIEVQD